MDCELCLEEKKGKHYEIKDYKSIFICDDCAYVIFMDKVKIILSKV